MLVSMWLGEKLGKQRDSLPPCHRCQTGWPITGFEPYSPPGYHYTMPKTSRAEKPPNTHASPTRGPTSEPLILLTKTPTPAYGPVRCVKPRLQRCQVERTQRAIPLGAGIEETSPKPLRPKMQFPITRRATSFRVASPHQPRMAANLRVTGILLAADSFNDFRQINTNLRPDHSP